MDIYIYEKAEVRESPEVLGSDGVLLNFCLLPGARFGPSSQKQLYCCHYCCQVLALSAPRHRPCALLLVLLVFGHFATVNRRLTDG